jgi:hypothetical protein
MKLSNKLKNMKLSNKLKNTKQLIINAASKYDTEFDVFTSEDANNNKYYYFHFKPRTEKNNAFLDAISILKKNKIRYTVPLKSDWKSLIFVPHNQSLNFLIEGKDSVYEIIKYGKK